MLDEQPRVLGTKSMRLNQRKGSFEFFAIKKKFNLPFLYSFPHYFILFINIFNLLPYPFSNFNSRHIVPLTPNHYWPRPIRATWKYAFKISIVQGMISCLHG